MKPEFTGKNERNVDQKMDLSQQSSLNKILFVCFDDDTGLVVCMWMAAVLITCSLKIIKSMKKKRKELMELKLYCGIYS